MSQVKHVKKMLDRNQIIVDCAPSITERVMSSSLCQECVIENYSKLKEKIYYTMTREAEFLERTLKLYKTKKIHTFQFHCEITNCDVDNFSGGNSSGRMEFHIMYDQNESVCPAELVETNYGFSIEVPTEAIANRGNKYLSDDNKLVIQFRYRHYFYTRPPICRSGISTTEDEEILSNDLVALYESGKFTDFAIVDEEGQKHFVHKSICKARSDTIDRIDDDNVVALTVQGKSSHVGIAVRYMYSGILPQLSVDDFLKLAVVAEDLDMKHLRCSIQFALLESLNQRNAKKIRDATSKLFNMHQIIAYAEELLPQDTRKKKKNRR